MAADALITVCSIGGKMLMNNLRIIAKSKVSITRNKITDPYFFDFFCLFTSKKRKNSVYLG